jgi:hypothetical protein
VAWGEREFDMANQQNTSIDFVFAMSFKVEGHNMLELSVRLNQELATLGTLLLKAIELLKGAGVLALFSGLRPSELSGLLCDLIDIERTQRATISQKA